MTGTLLRAVAVLLAGYAPLVAALSPIQARLASCDDAVMHAAATELLRDAAHLQEPLLLYQAALGERRAGNREEAAFLLLAARLRTARQALFEPGDRTQLFAVYEMTSAPLILPALEVDPRMSRRVAQRVRDWDRVTPDPFRDGRAIAPEQLARIDAVLARWLDPPALDAAGLAVVRQSEAYTEQVMREDRAERCAAGMPDLDEIEAATRRIRSEAEALVRMHPLVLRRADGAIAAISTASWRKARSGLPKRLTVSVRPSAGKLFEAEVDADTTLDDDGRLASVRVSLACVTDLSIGKRGGRSKDICLDDPAALRPSDPAAQPVP